MSIFIFKVIQERLIQFSISVLILNISDNLIWCNLCVDILLLPVFEEKQEVDERKYEESNPYTKSCPPQSGCFVSNVLDLSWAQGIVLLND